MLERFDDVLAFRDSLDTESDRGCALMAAAFLDSELDALLRSSTVDDAGVHEDVFAQGRPVSTFSARIDLAYLLGLIDAVTRRDLHLIRRIRNDFSHVHNPLTFEEPSISARSHELKMHFREAGELARKVFCSSAVAALAVIHSGMHDRSRPVPRRPADLSNAVAMATALANSLGAADDESARGGVSKSQARWRIEETG